MEHTVTHTYATLMYMERKAQWRARPAPAASFLPLPPPPAPSCLPFLACQHAALADKRCNGRVRVLQESSIGA